MVDRPRPFPAVRRGSVGKKPGPFVPFLKVQQPLCTSHDARRAPTASHSEGCDTYNLRIAGSPLAHGELLPCIRSLRPAPATIRGVAVLMLGAGVGGAVGGVPEVPHRSGLDAPPALGAVDEAGRHLGCPPCAEFLVGGAISAGGGVRAGRTGHAHPVSGQWGVTCSAPTLGMKRPGPPQSGHSRSGTVCYTA